jgi:hypothetical protein
MGKSFRIGEITLTPVVEQQLPLFDVFEFFPDVTPELYEENRSWLEPWAIDPATRKLIICVQSYLVRTPHHTILVDSCVGNDKPRPGLPFWHMMKGKAFLQGLATAGVSPADVDFVMCTHLHVDHVGWNTRLENGGWVPTFPNARYVFSERELAYWAALHAKNAIACIADSVLPILDAGKADLVKSDHALNDHVRLVPTPGHTPDHFLSGRRPRPRRRGDHRRSHPFAAPGTLSRNLLQCGRRCQTGRCEPPFLFRALLRHRHPLLHGALPPTFLRPRLPMGRRFPVHLGLSLSSQHDFGRSR